MRKSQRNIALIVAPAVIVAGAIIYGLFDPASNPFPRCPFLTLTGWQCPGCGSQRALHALLHGHVATAFAYNPILFLLVPYGGIVTWLEYRPTAAPRLHRALTSLTATGILLAIIILWTILRNVL